MTRFGFHASHEQIDPRRLLRDVQQAEAAGFEMAMCSDHFSPWTSAQGHSGYAWSWLGAALDNGNWFGVASILLGAVGSLFGIYAGYKADSYI